MERRLLVLALAVGTGAASSLSAHRRAAPQPRLGDHDACIAHDGVPHGFGRDAHAGMIWIEGGQFNAGSIDGYAEERPAPGARPIEVTGFWIDRTEVTNAQFAAFVAATGYVTHAERAGQSAVFHVPEARDLDQRTRGWWRAQPGASWRHPEGPGSTLRGREQHPVVHVAHEDASAYASWLGRALPSEDQWEYAALGGAHASTSAAAPVAADGSATANVWQGDFPTRNSAADGFVGDAPVGCFTPNAYGLHDMIGNVWEWTRDDYLARYEPVPAPSPAAGTASCHAGASDRPKVIKGGSFLCAANFCARYRASARHPHEEAMTTNHVGFRTVSAP